MRRTRSRIFALAALCVAVIALLRVTGEDPYRLTLEFESSSQLVKGNEVKIGGIPVGKVTSIDLTEDYRAEVEIEIDPDEEMVPLPEGTVAAIRNDALASVAGRYIQLSPGPADAPKIEDGARIGTDDTRSTVDTDQVLASLDKQTREDIRRLIRTGAYIFEGEAAGQANDAFQTLPPAASQGAALMRELNRDDRALTRMLRESRDVVGALASRPDDLETLTADALAATGELAAQSASLDSSLHELPPTLRSTNTTLVNLRAAIGDLRPLVRDLQPAAAPLARTLTDLAPVAEKAVPVTRRLNNTVSRPGKANDLHEALETVEPVRDEGVPAFNATDEALGDLQPIVTELRPYVPDLIGFTQGFGGTGGGYYDANGRYLRVSLQASLYTLEGASSLVPLPELDGLVGLRTGVNERCPGAATQKLPDESNPFFEVDGTCDPEDMPR
jgi:phospholipid/cholesterol/gamma-HCH transport system substrate-binding protein